MKILVPVDGSRYATESLRIAAGQGRNNGTQLYVMTVVPSVADIDLELSPSARDLLLETLKQHGEDLLNRSVEQLRMLGLGAVRPVLTIAPSPAHEIISFSEREKIDLIVMGFRGKSATGRFPLGSVASRVVRHALCSVYVVKELVS